MTRQEILNANQNKTWKIKQLLELGLTRTEVTVALGCSYGFVQNVFARSYPDRVRSRRRNLREVVEEATYNLTHFTFNHTFGVEIEAFGITRDELVTELTAAGITTEHERYNHRTRNHWKVTTDGSLNGTNTFELVSPKLTGEAGLRQLKTVTLILRGLGAKINRSCGLHIHFDASDFQLETWKNLYKNYAKLEYLIDSFMPQSRRGSSNRYCKSMRVTNFEELIDAVGHTASMQDGLERLENSITHRNRYYKLNSRAFWRHGSVEFRQHAGTTSFEKISNWIIFLARLIEYSKHEYFRTENEQTLKNFLPDELISYFLRRREELS